MPTTLLRGRTGASSRTEDSGSSVSVTCTPTYSGSPARATTVASSSGSPSSSTSPVTTPYCGSSPVVNLAIRTEAEPTGGTRSPRCLPLTAVDILDEPTWTRRQAAHEARVDAWVEPHLARRRTGRAHPVEDFLFTYYQQRPAALRRWHPGSGVGLEHATEHAGWKGYETQQGVTTVSADHVASRVSLVRGLRALLAATASRPSQLGCFGMHEWA